MPKARDPGAFSSAPHLSFSPHVGCPHSNWSEFETSNYFDSRIQLRFSGGDLSALDPVTNSARLQTVCEADWEVGPPHIVTGDIVGEGNGFFWRTWKDDIKRAAELGELHDHAPHCNADIQTWHVDLSMNFSCSAHHASLGLSHG